MSRSSVNAVTIVGRLGRDPEARATSSGHTVSNMSVATDDGFGDNARTNWHRVVAFGKQAEFANTYLKKGDLVAIQGRIDYSSYEKNGVEMKGTDIVADRVTSLGSGSPAGGGETEDEGPISEPTDSLPF